jgi:hypothetical protein
MTNTQVKLIASLFAAQAVTGGCHGSSGYAATFHENLG